MLLTSVRRLPRIQCFFVSARLHRNFSASVLPLKSKAIVCPFLGSLTKKAGGAIMILLQM